MIYSLFWLFVSLVLILLSCELFTNSVEWLGKKLKVGDGVVGSLLSAVGTCLPETMIPIIAILFSKGQESVDIGIGAIIGAPFMLSTLAFFVTGFSVIIFSAKRHTGMNMTLNRTILMRDMRFFIIIYFIGIIAAFVKPGPVRISIAFLLLLAYVYYIYLTIKNDSQEHSRIEALYLTRVFKLQPSMFTIMIQLFIALFGIVAGAHEFVKHIEVVSVSLGVPALALSLIITPIATELPEKFNSISWIRRGKDTLAMGNITGAMVFQGCIPVSIGILATPWQLDTLTLLSAFTAMLSTGLVYMYIKIYHKLNPYILIQGAVLYGAYILFVFTH